MKKWSILKTSNTRCHKGFANEVAIELSFFKRELNLEETVFIFQWVVMPLWCLNFIYILKPRNRSSHSDFCLLPIFLNIVKNKWLIQLVNSAGIGVSKVFTVSMRGLQKANGDEYYEKDLFMYFNIFVPKKT